LLNFFLPGSKIVVQVQVPDHQNGQKVNFVVIAMIAAPVNAALAGGPETGDYNLVLENIAVLFAAVRVLGSRLLQDYRPDFDAAGAQKVYPLDLRADAPGFDKNGFVAQRTPQKNNDNFLYFYMLT